MCSPEEELQEVTGFPGREEGHVFRGNIGQRGTLTPGIVFRGNIGQRGTLTAGEHSLQGQLRAEGHTNSRWARLQGQHRAKGHPYSR